MEQTIAKNLLVLLKVYGENNNNAIQTELKYILKLTANISVEHQGNEFQRETEWCPL